MQLTDKEDGLYGMLAILSMKGKPLTFAELVKHAHGFAELLGVDDLSGQLVIQVGTVGDEQDGRRMQTGLMHDKTRQEDHRETLATSGRSKICAAFAITLRLLMT